MTEQSISWLTTFDRKQELNSISTQYTQFFEIGNFSLIAIKGTEQTRSKEAKNFIFFLSETYTNYHPMF